MATNATSLGHHVVTYHHNQLVDQAKVRKVMLATQCEGPGANPNRIFALNLVPVTAGEYPHLAAQAGAPLR